MTFSGAFDEGTLLTLAQELLTLYIWVGVLNISANDQYKILFMK